MPLSKVIQMQCDSCGHCVHVEATLSSAKSVLLKKGYVTVNNRWYCDSKCSDNHKAYLQNIKKGLSAFDHSTSSYIPSC